MQLLTDDYTRGGLTVPGYDGLDRDWQRAKSINPYSNCAPVSALAVAQALEAIQFPHPVLFWVPDPIAPETRRMDLMDALAIGLDPRMPVWITWAIEPGPDSDRITRVAAPTVREFSRDFTTAIKRWFAMVKGDAGITANWKEFVYDLNARATWQALQDKFAEALNEKDKAY